LPPGEIRARKHGGEIADEVEENSNLFSLGNGRQKEIVQHIIYICLVLGLTPWSWEDHGSLKK